MAANAWFLQFLADLLGVVVERPKNVESTVTGAAYLAGVACGMYASLEDVAQLWSMDKRFTPQYGRSTKRCSCTTGGFEAVSRVRDDRLKSFLRGPKIGCQVVRKLSCRSRPAVLLCIATACVAIEAAARVVAACAKSLSRAPVSPSLTTSMGPVTGNAATGVPHAIASSITRPKVSVRLGKTKTSAPANSSASSLPNLYPKK